MPELFPDFCEELVRTWRDKCFNFLATRYSHWAYQQLATEFREFARHEGLSDSQIEQVLQDQQPYLLAELAQRKWAELEGRS